MSGDPEAIDYQSLNGMTSSVDVIVVARPRDIVRGRDIAGNPEGTDIGYFATVHLAVDEIVGGSIKEGDPKALQMEIFLGAGDPGPGVKDVAYARFATSVPTERVLLFLVNKGKFFERLGLSANDPGAGYDYYMIASGQAYVRDVGGQAEMWGSAPTWLARFQGDPFDQVVDKVRAEALS